MVLRSIKPSSEETLIIPRVVVRKSSNVVNYNYYTKTYHLQNNIKTSTNTGLRVMEVSSEPGVLINVFVNVFGYVII